MLMFVLVVILLYNILFQIRDGYYSQSPLIIHYCLIAHNDSNIFVATPISSKITTKSHRMWFQYKSMNNDLQFSAIYQGHCN